MDTADFVEELANFCENIPELDSSKPLVSEAKRLDDAISEILNKCYDYLADCDVS
jgi:hypothetical protein